MAEGYGRCLDGLQRALDSFDARFEEARPDLYPRLRSGLSAEEIRTLEARLAPYWLPKDLVVLYSWHDGWDASAGGDHVNLLPSGRFNSLGEAVEQYAHWCSMNEQQEGAWNPLWFPAFGDSSGEFVELHEEPDQPAGVSWSGGVVWRFDSHDAVVWTRYDSVAAIFRASTTLWMRGLMPVEAVYPEGFHQWVARFNRRTQRPYGHLYKEISRFPSPDEWPTTWLIAAGVESPPDRRRRGDRPQEPVANTGSSRVDVTTYMEGLRRVLDDLDEWFRTKRPDLSPRFRPGLSQDEIRDLEKRLAPYRLPADLVTLYEWHDGWSHQAEEGYVPLLAEAGQFNSLAEAVDQYERWIGVMENLPEAWHPLWFPAFGDSAGDLVELQPEEGQPAGVVWGYDSHDPDLSTAFDSVESLFTTALEGWRRGLLPRPTPIDPDFPDFRAFVASHNPATRRPDGYPARSLSHFEPQEWPTSWRVVNRIETQTPADNADA